MNRSSIILFLIIVLGIACSNGQINWFLDFPGYQPFSPAPVVTAPLTPLVAPLLSASPEFSLGVSPTGFLAASPVVLPLTPLVALVPPVPPAMSPVTPPVTPPVTSPVTPPAQPLKPKSPPSGIPPVGVPPIGLPPVSLPVPPVTLPPITIPPRLLSQVPFLPKWILNPPASTVPERNFTPVLSPKEYKRCPNKPKSLREIVSELVTGDPDFIPPLVTTKTPLLGGIPIFGGTLSDILELAGVTKTEPECFMYERHPLNITDLNPLMGLWWETVKYTDNQTQRDACEQCTYSLTSDKSFDKDALYHIRQPDGTWINIVGNGTLINPGIVDIKWQDLQTGAPNSLVYIIIAADYKKYVVGYTCLTGSKKPEIVIQTRDRNPPQSVIDEAIKAICDKGLPLSWLGCVS